MRKEYEMYVYGATKNEKMKGIKVNEAEPSRFRIGSSMPRLVEIMTGKKVSSEVLQQRMCMLPLIVKVHSH